MISYFDTGVFMSDNKKPFADFRPDRNFTPHSEERSRFFPSFLECCPIL
jgi:hypothetical protein